MHKSFNWDPSDVAVADDGNCPIRLFQSLVLLTGTSFNAKKLQLPAAQPILSASRIERRVAGPLPWRIA
jgi:hypothetical protein